MRYGARELPAGFSSSLSPRKEEFLVCTEQFLYLPPGLDVPVLYSESGQKLPGGLDLTSFTTYFSASLALVSCTNAYR